MLTIRLASVADIALIIELTMQVWPQTYTPILGEEQVRYMLNRFYTPESLTDQMTAQGHEFIIAYSNGVPVAFASYAAMGEHVYKLHKIYIAANRQGQGIGKQVLAHIVAHIKRMGATALQLNVNIHNSTAKRFYEQTGFKHIGDEDIDIGGGYFMNDHILRLEV